MAEPVLLTERLRLRDWQPEEAARMLDMYARADVVRFLGSVPTPMRDLAQAGERIEVRAASNAAEAAAGSPCGWWAVEVRETGVVAGTVALVRVDGSSAPESPVEVAWHLHPDSQGHGYATEAARGVLARGHAAGLEEVLALTDEANTASQAVCRRLRMEHLGATERFYDKLLVLWVSRRPA